MIGAAWALAEREIVRFLRQPNRIAGAIGQPLIFWVLFGAAFRGSFRPPPGSGNYAQFFLPGIAVLIALFTAIFSTMSIIEDRREGFLQGVLAAPAPRSAIVLGKALGGTLLAVLQSALFLLLAPFAGASLTAAGFLGALGVLGAVSFWLTCLGFVIAWRMDSVQGFHAVMSVFLIPLWLLSGSVFPAEGAAPWLARLVRLNPLTYGVDALRAALGLGGAARAASGVWISLAACAILFVAALRLASRPEKGDSG